ncbi:hypothetical protein, partial [Pseudomonas aeruginosa]|uniref:hypothetical protein n=1 Tax=Pseudomonas aeruginosa TaxID=287 RepID=UPI001BAF7E30
MIPNLDDPPSAHCREMAAKTKSPWSRRADNRFAVIRSPWLRRGRVEPAAQPALDTPRNGCHAG